jgi:hypothetical protein
MATAKVLYAPESDATPVVVSDAEEIHVHHQAPDNIVLILPAAGGGRGMRVTVDAQELDKALSEAHEKLVEHSADEDKKRVRGEAGDKHQKKGAQQHHVVGDFGTGSHPEKQALVDPDLKHMKGHPDPEVVSKK